VFSMQCNLNWEEHMSRTIWPSLMILGFAVLAAPATASAQDAPVRVRGTIERVDGDAYVVKERSGERLKVKLADNATVVAVTRASLSDVRQGSYVGVSGMPQADGSQRALEVHIFPENMRG